MKSHLRKTHSASSTPTLPVNQCPGQLEHNWAELTRITVGAFWTRGQGLRCRLVWVSAVQPLSPAWVGARPWQVETLVWPWLQRHCSAHDILTVLPGTQANCSPSRGPEMGLACGERRQVSEQPDPDLELFLVTPTHSLSGGSPGSGRQYGI